MLHMKVLLSIGISVYCGAPTRPITPPSRTAPTCDSSPFGPTSSMPSPGHGHQLLGDTLLVQRQRGRPSCAASAATLLIVSVMV
jgi:hypothetical protein